MLDTTRSGTFVAGSNRLAAASGAAWLALLPNQELGTVLVLGVPDRGVLSALARASGSLIVRCRTKRQARRARALLAGTAAEVTTGAIPQAIFDLIVVARAEGAPPEPTLRLLAPGGSVVAEESGASRRDPGWTDVVRVVLRPAFGEVTAAVPELDGNARRALESRGLWSDRVVAHAFGRSREVGGRWLRVLPERRLVVSSSGPPSWLRRIAAEAGVDIGGHDWAMAAPGRYRSNKILFFLFEPGSDTPALVVKATRDAELNVRLEGEREALGHLRAMGAADPSSIPQVVFFGTEGGRAVLGLTALDGRPFTTVTPNSADHPHAVRAFDWLTDLGAATAEPAEGAAAELAAHLQEIFDRFVALYDLSGGHRAFLEEQIRIIQASSEPLPVVFQHGDPGAWNLLVREDGTVAFLDWESAERRGVPLWDVFHFARSYAVIAGRAAGERNMMRSIERILYAPTPMNAMVAGLVRRYRDRIGVPADLVGPLFHMSWMHRALKEATRLPEARLRESHYLALLTRGIDDRDAPGLQRLLVAEQD